MDINNIQYTNKYIDRMSSDNKYDVLWWITNVLIYTQTYIVQWLKSLRWKQTEKNIEPTWIRIHDDDNGDDILTPPLSWKPVVMKSRVISTVDSKRGGS